MFAKDDFLKEIKSGLYSAWYFSFLTNDTPYVSMKPEYLTTVMLGQHLLDVLSKNFSNGTYLIRFEEQTKDVATRAFSVPPFPCKQHNVHGRAKKSSGEEGSVDLTIYRQTKFLPETIAIIEVKNFDQRDDLLIKDLDRNSEFIGLSQPSKQNNIIFTFLTFFLNDKESRTQEEADLYINQKKQHYQKITNGYCTRTIDATLTIDTLANYPLLTDSTANEPDENGQTQVELEEHHHIVYGVICMTRKDISPTPDDL